MITYILIALGVFGTLTVDAVGYGGTIAEAADRPRGGRIHDDGDRSPARDCFVGERNAVRSGA
jgi:hypothetical protein